MPWWALVATCCGAHLHHQPARASHDPHQRPRRRRRPLPDLAPARRVGRDEPGTGLLGRLRRVACRRCRRGRLLVAVHDRPRQRRRLRGRPRPRGLRRRTRRRGAGRRRRRAGAGAHLGRPTALARSGEGRHAHGHRRRRQRRVGPALPPRRPATVAAARLAVTAGDRRPGRLHLHRRRPHRERSAGPPRSQGGGARRTHRRPARPTAFRPTRRRRDGSATTTTRWPGWPASPSRTGSRCSR